MTRSSADLSPTARAQHGSSLVRPWGLLTSALLRLFHRSDERELSMADTDENATTAAGELQAANDAEDLDAGSPAEEGGEG